jgi:hypothetical protein
LDFSCVYIVSWLDGESRPAAAAVDGSLQKLLNRQLLDGIYIRNMHIIHIVAKSGWARSAWHYKAESRQMLSGHYDKARSPRHMTKGGKKEDETQNYFPAGIAGIDHLHDTRISHGR